MRTFSRRDFLRAGGAVAWAEDQVKAAIQGKLETKGRP